MDFAEKESKGGIIALYPFHSHLADLLEMTLKSGIFQLVRCGKGRQCKPTVSYEVRSAEYGKAKL